jgi:hypothetical protein
MMMATETRTDEALVRRLEAAAQGEMTKEEVHAQRVSFAYGNMPQDSSVSRAQVEAVIARIDGERPRHDSL